jgi:hypothetical protein
VELLPLPGPLPIPQKIYRSLRFTRTVYTLCPLYAILPQGDIFTKLYILSCVVNKLNGEKRVLSYAF